MKIYTKARSKKWPRGKDLITEHLNYTSLRGPLVSSHRSISHHFWRALTSIFSKAVKLPSDEKWKRCHIQIFCEKRVIGAVTSRMVSRHRNKTRVHTLLIVPWTRWEAFHTVAFRILHEASIALQQIASYQLKSSAYLQPSLTFESFKSRVD